jgi:transcriptional regulator of acetoin/glycerol metabolism
VATDRVTDSTLTSESGGPRAETSEGFVVRWVFPLPPAVPTWLTRARTTFGRDLECTVRLESGYISRQHAAIVRSGPLWIVSDLSSKNGVAVNGRAVREDVLSPGDVLRFGDLVGVCMTAPLGADLAAGALGPGIFGGFRLRKAVERMRGLARTALSVVLEGETGTGKETFARALHEASGRPGPFRAVNCAVYSKEMAAAELFGYRKGAFTGAQAASLGHVRAAQGGSLLLDELTELAPDVQAMLLRVLESREVLPLGESKPVPVDVRFIAATQVPLAAAVAAGAFRSDLRARLEGAIIALPPLRESREVVLDTFLTMFEQHAKWRPDIRAPFAEGLALHPWTLNLRELDTAARRLAASCSRGQALDREALEPALGRPPEARPDDVPGNDPAGRHQRPPYDPEDLGALTAALGRFDGNLTRAASALGLTRAKAYRMLAFARRLPGTKTGAKTGPKARP